MDHATIAAESAAFKAARDKCTPGPWEVKRRWSNGCEIIPRITCQPDEDRGCGWIADLIGAPYLGHKSTLPNADFIAAARSTRLPEHIDSLLEENARLRRALATAHSERLQEVLDDIDEDEKRPDEERLHLRDHLMPLLRRIHNALEGK